LGVVATVLSVVSCALLATLLWFQRPSESDALNKVLPSLVPAPTSAQQTQLIAAMKAHPNPPLDVDLLPPLGSDATGLATLFAVMSSWRNADGVLCYQFGLRPSPEQHDMDDAFVHIEVAGNPPRVIRRRFETAYAP
jgi:hypothetical protein